jgi:hypothetical protein
MPIRSVSTTHDDARATDRSTRDENRAFIDDDDDDDDDARDDDARDDDDDDARSTSFAPWTREPPRARVERDGRRPTASAKIEAPTRR